MSWEAVTALATLASAIIVAIAAVAAVIQIRHLRAGNQLEAILRIYDTFNGREMLEARRFCLSEFPAMLNAASAAQLIDRGLDARIMLVANFHNEIGALVVDRFLDERLAWPLVPITARLWKIMEPLAAEYRKRQDDPVWADFQYLGSLEERVSRASHVGRYPRAFQKRLASQYSED